MWEKLAWNIEQLEEIQRLQNYEIEPLCYALIDVCIASQSLQWWTLRDLKARQATDPKEFEKKINEWVVDQAMCVSIANSAKHANYSGEWLGTLELEFEPSDEDTPGGWIIRHHVAGSEERHVTIAKLRELQRQWLDVLVRLALVEQSYTGPAWFQNKLKRWFGNSDHAVSAAFASTEGILKIPD